MKILFLDDNYERLRKAPTYLSKLLVTDEAQIISLVETADQAIQCLKDNAYDAISLDHDLGGEVYVDSGREDCGMEVVRYLVEFRHPTAQVVLVHSWNTVAGTEMVKKLEDAGYISFYIPFRT